MAKKFKQKPLTQAQQRGFRAALKGFVPSHSNYVTRKVTRQVCRDVARFQPLNADMFKGQVRSGLNAYSPH